MDMVFPCNQIPLVCLSYCYFTLRLLYIIDNNEDGCTSVLRSTKTHISSLSIPTQSQPLTHLISSHYRMLRLYSSSIIYRLSLTSPHNSNRQQIDCTIQYHETSPSSLHIIIPKSRHATSLSRLDLPWHTLIGIEAAHQPPLTCPGTIMYMSLTWNKVPIVAKRIGAEILVVVEAWELVELAVACWVVVAIVV